MPTRNARTGGLFTTDGVVNIKNLRWQKDDAPLDAGLDAYHSRTFSRGYLRHLTKTKEPLYMEIASVQNLALYLWTMREMRAAILDGRFPAWARRVVRAAGPENLIRNPVALLRYRARRGRGA